MFDLKSLLLLRPGRDLWMGTDDDPDHVLVTDLRGEVVSYKDLPISVDTKTVRMEAMAFLQLAKTGTRTHLRRLEKFLRCERARTLNALERSWIEDEVERLGRILAGEPVPVRDETEFLAMEVQVRVLGLEVDPWDFLDEITGGCCNLYNREEDLYEVSVVGVNELVRLQGNPRIEVVGYTFRRNGEEG